MARQEKAVARQEKAVERQEQGSGKAGTRSFLWKGPHLQKEPKVFRVQKHPA